MLCLRSWEYLRRMQLLSALAMVMGLCADRQEQGQGGGRARALQDDERQAPAHRRSREEASPEDVMDCRLSLGWVCIGGTYVGGDCGAGGGYTRDEGGGDVLGSHQQP